MIRQIATSVQESNYNDTVVFAYLLAREVNGVLWECSEQKE